MRQTAYLLLLFFWITIACKTEKSSSSNSTNDSVALLTEKNQKDTFQKVDTLSAFPKVKDISKYKETTVIPTLEHTLSYNQ